MTLTEFKQHLKDMETDYLYAGQENKSDIHINRWSTAAERAAHKRRKKQPKRDRLTVEEKQISISNGLLCSYILGQLNLVGEE